MSREKKKILYVDDEQWLMSGIIDSLSHDYIVKTARNGDQAILILENAEEKYNLIIIDIMMPIGDRVNDNKGGRTSGVELVRIIKNELKLRTPIICYTVVNDKKVQNELMKLGVKEIISKTKLPSHLEIVIKKFIK